MNWDRRPQQVGLPTGTSDGPSARRAGGVGRRIRRGDVGPHRERGCAARRPVASADERAVRPYPDRLAHRASGARPVRKTRTVTTSAARPLSAVASIAWRWGSSSVSHAPAARRARGGLLLHWRFGLTGDEPAGGADACTYGRTPASGRERTGIDHDGNSRCSGAVAHVSRANGGQRSRFRIIALMVPAESATLNGTQAISRS